MALLGLLSWSCSDDNSLQGSGDGMGQINGTFKANYSVKSSMKATPEASDEVESVAPEIQDFIVRLTKSDGTYNKTWSSIAQFPSDSKFATGAYTMEIYYGDIEEEGFENPYYYGSAKFNVEDEETATPEIEATLCNTMVSIAYTEAFKQYFSDYTARVHSAGGSYIVYVKDEERPAYFKPGKLSFQLSLLKSNGSILTIEPAAIDNAEARTHYKVTFDVNGGEVGEAVLTVTFDDETELEPIEVPLSEELMITEAPSMILKGFENNTPIEIIEGDDVEASVVLVAQAGIASVTLTTSSEYLLANGWVSELDLMSATAEQQTVLTKYGLSVKGLWSNPDKLAVVDFSDLIPNLKPLNGNSTHTFTLQLKDIYGRTVETPATLTVNAPAVIFSMSDAQKSEAGSNVGTFTLTFNGKQEYLSFKALNDYGIYEDAAIKSMIDNGDGTYTVTVAIPSNAESTTIKGYYRGEVKGSIDVKIGLTFSISVEDYNIWATKAILDLNAKNTVIKNKVVNGVKAVYVNGSETTNYSVDASAYTITVNGLTAGTQNTIKVVVDDDGDEAEASIALTTEAATQVPNSDMESWTVEKCTASNGVLTTKTYYNFLPYVSGSDSEGWWATNNQVGQNGTIALGIWWEGCFASSTSYCTDVHGGSKAAYIFTNGHGRHYSDTGQILYTDGSYIGSLFIGSFDYNEDEYDGDFVQGHSFTSRPSSLSFWYKYAPYNTDAFKVWVAIKSGDETIAEGTYVPATSSTAVSSYTQATVNLNYTVTNKKATTICIQFLSSTKSSISSSDIDKNVTINYPEVGDWSAHRGSELWIDDLTLNY